MTQEKKEILDRKLGTDLKTHQASFSQPCKIRFVRLSNLLALASSQHDGNFKARTDVDKQHKIVYIATETSSLFPVVSVISSANMRLFLFGR